MLASYNHYCLLGYSCAFKRAIAGPCSSTEHLSLQYKHLAKALSMVVMLCTQLSICAKLSSRPGLQQHVAYVTLIQLAITFTLNFGLSSCSYSYLLYLCACRLQRVCILEPFITPTIASYNFNISSCSYSSENVLHQMQQAYIREILLSRQIPSTTHNQTLYGIPE